MNTAVAAAEKQHKKKNMRKHKKTHKSPSQIEPKAE